MTGLETHIGNIEFINPFILASAPPTRNAEMIARAFQAGWGGAVIKTATFNYEKMVNASPRITAVEGGLQNIELISDIPPEAWAEDIKELKARFPQNIVIASIAAEATNLADWQKLAEIMQVADVIELNLSCPHGLPDMKMGSACCDVPELAGSIVKAVKEVSGVPVWAKLSPNVTSIRHLAEVCLKNGADGLTAINTVKGFAGIDINTGKPKLETYGGISGEVIKPIALKAVSEIATEFACPISATGGIKNWQDAVEFTLLGATTLQICTEVMLKGYGIIDNLKEGLSNYLGEKSLDEVRGNSLKFIKPFSQIDKKTQIPVVNKETCFKCGKCIKACKDAGYQAISLSKDSFPVIDSQKCSGCGLCKAICPTKSISTKSKAKIT